MKSKILLISMVVIMAIVSSVGIVFANSFVKENNSSQVQIPKSITLNGEITNMGSASSTYGYFQWGYDANYGYSSAPVALTKTGKFSINVTGVSENRILHYRAVLKNGNVSVYGEDRIFIPIITPTTANDFVPIYKLGNYIGKVVKVRGVYRGWEGGHGSPPVTRSDWLLSDETGICYVTGVSGNPSISEISGIVRINSQCIYIEVPRRNGRR